MSEYQQYLQERNSIDLLLNKGYRITRVMEDLSGATLELAKMENGERKTEVLQILTANGRRYFSVLLLGRKKAESD